MGSLCLQVWRQDRERGEGTRATVSKENRLQVCPQLFPSPSGIQSHTPGPLETLNAPSMSHLGMGDQGLENHAFSRTPHSLHLATHTHCLESSENQLVQRYSFFLPKSSFFSPKTVTSSKRYFRTEMVSFKQCLTRPLSTSY